LNNNLLSFSDKFSEYLFSICKIFPLQMIREKKKIDVKIIFLGFIEISWILSNK